jgi:hypothetical protein
MINIPTIPFIAKRRKSSAPVTPPPPINTIASVTIQNDGVTCDIVFTAGTVVTAVNNPDDNFFVNYSGGQTAGPIATIVSPVHVRIVLSDAVDSPATWEVDDVAWCDFASGTFAGPNNGDVIFA